MVRLPARKVAVLEEPVLNHFKQIYWISSGHSKLKDVYQKSKLANVGEIMKNSIASLILILLSVTSINALERGINGDYLEVRTSDVYAGACFANSEVNLVGKEAILTWRINQGFWKDIPLKGLSVIVVVKARATLGDPFAQVLPTRSAIIVDQNATAKQKTALIDFVQSMAGDLVKQVVWIKSAEINIKMDSTQQFASVSAGDIAQIKTRALGHNDHLCGNEEVYYTPLVQLSQFRPAYTIEHKFNGKGLNSTWSNPNKRSAFVGTFTH